MELERYLKWDLDGNGQLVLINNKKILSLLGLVKLNLCFTMIILAEWARVRDRDWCGTANGAMMRLLSLKIGFSNSQVTSHRARKLEWERDVYFTSNRRKVWSF